MPEREIPEPKSTDERSAPATEPRRPQVVSTRRPTPTLTDENPLIFRGLD